MQPRQRRSGEGIEALAAIPAAIALQTAGSAPRPHSLALAMGTDGLHGKPGFNQGRDFGQVSVGKHRGDGLALNFGQFPVPLSTAGNESYPWRPSQVGT